MQNSSTVYIYALCQPDDSRAVRYIGKTNDLADRYDSHLGSPRYKHERHLPKTRWVAKLLREELVPVMEVLEICDESNWRESEQAWISFYRSNGTKKLLNISDGGGNVQPVRNYIGERFGRLVVLERLEGRKLKCRCDCGKESIHKACMLVTGNASSCGCLHREMCIARNIERRKTIAPGTRFGLLTVLALSTEPSTSGSKYVVQCDCGSPQKLAVAFDLYNKRTTSCGCAKRKRMRERHQKTRAAKLT